MRKRKRISGILLLVLLLCLISSCDRQEEDFFAPLFAFVKSYGYDYTLTKAGAEEEEINVPIYNQTVWHKLTLNEKEELLVYFDTSNRAKQLAEQFCTDPEEGKVIYVGMRFIIIYRGEDDRILQMMDDWQKQYPV